MPERFISYYYIAPDGFTAKFFTATDDAVTTLSQKISSNEELLLECTNNRTNDKEDGEVIEDDSEEIKKPSRKKTIFEVLHLTEDYLLFLDDNTPPKCETVQHN